MVRVKLERFHQGIAKNSTFNIEDLIPYRGSIPSPTREDFVETGTTPANDSDSFSVSEFPDVIPLPPPSKSLQKDLVADILDDNVVLTRHGSYQKFLVRWKYRPDSYITWISKEDLERIDPDILEQY
ncbi:hypothetical protein ACFX15_021752 [Malus domestica]